MAESVRDMDFDAACSSVRSQLKGLAALVKDIRQQHPGVTNGKNADVKDQGEMIANLMLAYRHIEDATMRIGKAIQAFDGGTSVYDK